MTDALPLLLALFSGLAFGAALGATLAYYDARRRTVRWDWPRRKETR